MRVLFLITGLGVGGAERQVVDLADRLAREGTDIMIVYLTGDAEVRPAEANVRVVGLGISKSLGGFCRGYAALRRLVATFRPDVVHSHMIHANLMARALRLTTKIPLLVCTAHSMNEGGKLRMLAYRLTDSLDDVFTNVGAQAVAAFEAKGAAPRGRMLAMANGIDTDKFRAYHESRLSVRTAEGATATDRILLAIGRLTDAKDYPNLLRAFSLLAPDKHRLALWIAGGGELLPQLTALAGELGISGRVRFLGVRPDVHLLLNAADVYVLSSAWEGLPLVIGESMASEKVVVATDCGGVREMLGACGFLVAPGDAQALAEGLSKALTMSEGDAKSMGEQARQRVVREFSLQSVVDGWRVVYGAPGRKRARSA